MVLVIAMLPNLPPFWISRLPVSDSASVSGLYVRPGSILIPMFPLVASTKAGKNVASVLVDVTVTLLALFTPDGTMVVVAAVVWNVLSGKRIPPMKAALLLSHRLPMTCRFPSGVAVPIPTLPAAFIVILATLLVVKYIGVAPVFLNSLQLVPSYWTVRTPPMLSMRAVSVPSRFNAR